MSLVKWILLNLTLSLPSLVVCEELLHPGVSGAVRAAPGGRGGHTATTGCSTQRSHATETMIPLVLFFWFLVDFWRALVYLFVLSSNFVQFSWSKGMLYVFQYKFRYEWQILRQWGFPPHVSGFINVIEIHMGLPGFWLFLIIVVLRPYMFIC